MWELVEIKLPVKETSSKIVKRNSRIVTENEVDYYVIYATKERNTKGFFRKDHWQTRSAGRFLCDLMQEEIGNNGFFTMDEVRYNKGQPSLCGLTRSQIEQIARETSADPEKDQVYIFAYDEKMAKASSKWLERKLDSYYGFRHFVGPFVV
jgi:Glu-tRNA(Gln) amidotransferase subunit E-like FAD-binding protein